MSTLKFSPGGADGAADIMIGGSSRVYFDRVWFLYPSNGIELQELESELYLKECWDYNAAGPSGTGIVIQNSGQVQLVDTQIYHGIVVKGKGTLHMEGDSTLLSDNSPTILFSDGGTLRVEDSTIRGGQPGIRATGAHVSIRNSQIRNNYGGGILLESPEDGSEIVNSVIRDNGVSQADFIYLPSKFGGLSVTNGNVDIMHSTFFDNDSEVINETGGELSLYLNRAHGILCNGAVIRLYHSVIYRDDGVVPSAKPTFDLESGCDISGSNNFFQKDAWFDVLADESALKDGNTVTEEDPLLDEKGKPREGSALISPDDTRKYNEDVAELIRTATGGVDIFGSPREQGVAPDIGAYETSVNLPPSMPIAFPPDAFP